MIEICWFLLTIHAPRPNSVNSRRNLAMRTGDKVIIHPDSKYAMGIAQGLFFPRENVLMSKLLRHLYGVVQKVFDVSLRWTRGHDGDIGNLLADTLANEGCAAEIPFDRDFVPSYWDAEEFTNVLAENDLNQTILVHEIMGAHVKRIKQLERQKRRETEEQTTTQPVRAPQPRPSCTLGDLTLAVAEAGHKFGRRRVEKPVRLPPEDEDKRLLRELAQRRRVTSDSFERVNICKTMNHIQRRIKRREMDLRAERTVDTARLPKWQMRSSGYGPLRETEIGEEANTHIEKQQMLTRYFGEIFASTTNPALPAWIHRRWSPRVLKNLRPLNQLWVREGLTKMAKNKTSGEDMVVTEMLLELDEDLLEEIALIFRDRLLNQDEFAWNVWEHHVVALIPKPNKDATLIKNLRPIAVLPVIYKWYSRCLGLLCEDELQKISVFQTAFTPGRQAEEVLFTIRQLVEKNNEWKKDISLCILDTDIAKAYDHVTFELVEKGLQKKGVPKPIIAAWLREWSQMKSDDEPESGNKVPTPASRKILAAGRPYGTSNLRGMHGYFTGALYGNMQG